MSEKLELCPACKQGHLKPAGRVNVGSTTPGEIRNKDSMRDLECDYCGHKQKNAVLHEEHEGVGEKLSDTVTKANTEEKGEEKLFTCDCGASFKTDQELHKHHQSHIRK